MKEVLALLFCLSLQPWVFADCGDRYLTPDFEELNIIRDIQFGSNINSEGELQDLFLDVYEPKDDTAALRPLLIYLHGGSFVSGDKTVAEATFICEEFARRGYVAAAIQYRKEKDFLSLLMEEKMIKAVMRAAEDTKAAIRYFRRQAVEEGNFLRVDTSQIILGGASAGSIAALHTVYLDDISELTPAYVNYVEDLGLTDGNLEGFSGNPGYSSKVIGLLNVSGALRDPNYMNNNTTPLLSVHSTLDLSVPYNFGRPYFLPTLPVVVGSGVLSNKADELGIHNILYRIQGFLHVPYEEGGEKIQPYYDSTITLMTRFSYSLLSCNPEQVITGIGGSSRPSFTMYPNPTSNDIHVSLQENTGGTIRLEVFDVQGQRLITRTLDERQGSVQLDGLLLPAGTYYLRITDLQSGKLFTEPFVKN